MRGFLRFFHRRRRQFPVLIFNSRSSSRQQFSLYPIRHRNARPPLPAPHSRCRRRHCSRQWEDLLHRVDHIPSSVPCSGRHENPGPHVRGLHALHIPERRAAGYHQDPGHHQTLPGMGREECDGTKVVVVVFQVSFMTRECSRHRSSLGPFHGDPPHICSVASQTSIIVSRTMRGQFLSTIRRNSPYSSICVSTTRHNSWYKCEAKYVEKDMAKASYDDHDLRW